MYLCGSAWVRRQGCVSIYIRLLFEEDILAIFVCYESYYMLHNFRITVIVLDKLNHLKTSNTCSYCLYPDVLIFNQHLHVIWVISPPSSLGIVHTSFALSYRPRNTFPFHMRTPTTAFASLVFDIYQHQWLTKPIFFLCDFKFEILRCQSCNCWCSCAIQVLLIQYMIISCLSIGREYHSTSFPLKRILHS